MDDLDNYRIDFKPPPEERTVWPFWLCLLTGVGLAMILVLPLTILFGVMVFNIFGGP